MNPLTLKSQKTSSLLSSLIIISDQLSRSASDTRLVSRGRENKLEETIAP